MFKVLGSEAVRTAVVRNAGNMIKLGGLAAATMLTSNVFRQACNNYIRTVYADYQSVREAIQEEAA